jgi:glycosyltransferase involved in cell wall biosynthesis
MRLLYFSRDYTTHDHRFLAKIAAAGHETFYLRLERGPHQLEDRALPAGVTPLQWAGGQSPARWQDGLRLVRSLRQVVRRVRPDLVQAGPIQRSAFLAALAGIQPLVTMSWGYDLLHDVHRGWAWEQAARFTLRRSAALVGDCRTIRDLAVGYGMDPARIVTFPWGADIHKYTPLPSGTTSRVRERTGWGEDTFVVLSTRSWTPLYGVEDLVRAFARAVQQRPQLRLLMLGSGPLSGKIKQIVRSAGLIHHVHFSGQVNQQDLPAYYQAADLYVSTSHSDGTSISLLEALASGTPVLLTDIPGNAEWITEHGKVGWLFADGSVPELEGALLHAVDNRSRLPEMGQAARALAEERGDWNKNFPQIEQAWDLALGA